MMSSAIHSRTWPVFAIAKHFGHFVQIQVGVIPCAPHSSSPIRRLRLLLRSSTWANAVAHHVEHRHAVAAFLAFKTTIIVHKPVEGDAVFAVHPHLKVGVVVEDGPVVFGVRHGAGLNRDDGEQTRINVEADSRPKSSLRRGTSKFRRRLDCRRPQQATCDRPRSNRRRRGRCALPSFRCPTNADDRAGAEVLRLKTFKITLLWMRGM